MGVAVTDVREDLCVGKGLRSRVEIECTVIEALPKAMYRVRGVLSGTDVLVSVSSEFRRGFVRILPGDQVAVELSPYDPNRGRITYRLK